MSDFERATHYDEVSHPYYGWDTVCELTETISRLDLPYKIVTACGTKAVAMVAEMQSLGVDPAALTIVRSYIPDLSAEGIRQAYESGKSMQTPIYDATPSFLERLETNVGKVDIAMQSVEFNGMRFSEVGSGDADAIVVERASSEGEALPQGNFVDGQRWELPPPGESVLFCNHTTAAINTLDEDGNVVVAAIDPSYTTTEPLSISRWKELQNFSEAIILSGNITDYGVPLQVHTNLMNDEQRSRFEYFLKENNVSSANLVTLSNLFVAHPKLYNAIISNFLNLQTESSDVQVRAADQYDYALHLAKVVRTGKEHELPVGIEASRKKVGEILGKLAPVMAYQHWLERTASLSM